jgi:hypothetical protein
MAIGNAEMVAGSSNLGPVATSDIVVDLSSVGKSKSDAEEATETTDVTEVIPAESTEAESATEVAEESLIETSITDTETESIKGSVSKTPKAPKAHNEDIVVETPKEEPVDKHLKFDEEQAKRLVDYSIKVGKELGFSKSELKELEQVAYNYNIGITQFTTDDLSQNGFRKIKVRASYEKLLKEDTLSEKVIESVKFCANNYESETFALNAKIPYHHVVAVTSYYEELLAQNNSKEKTLDKMMQMGGNKFNIFVLHKFIRIMRELNE